MPSIVLDSFSRASIRFEKLATQEADRLAQLQTTAQIDIKEAHSVPFKAGADRLTQEVADIEHELSKADKLLGSLETSFSALEQMRTMVDRVQDLEKAAASETDTALSASYIDQADELKEQIITLGETASFRGNNFLKDWGQQNFSIGGQNFSIESVSMNDVVSGFAYRGGNVLGIEDGDFDSSAYSNLIAAFGPDTINNTYTDFTGNLPDGTMVNGANIAQIGPNGSYGVELPTKDKRADGSYVQLPALTLPAEMSIGVWTKIDSTGVWQRVLDFSNDSATNGNGGNGLLLARSAWSDRMRVLLNVDPTMAVDNWDLDAITPSEATTPGKGLANGEWAYWMITVKDAGGGTAELSLYKDGNLISTSTQTATLSAVTRTENYLGASDWSHDDTLDGAIADFVVFDGALDATEAMDWYNNVGLTGLENSFFTMGSEALSESIDKIEAHLTGVQVAVEATRNQLAVKAELYTEEATNLLSIDSEEVAVQSSLAGMRQTLAVTSLGITSSTQANILNLFG